MIPKPNFKRRVPKLSKRGKFSEKTITKIINRDDGLCVVCFAQANDIHHCLFKSQGGRGVFTNGVCLCRDCHSNAHNSAEEAKRLQQMMIDKYGVDYYKDEHDL